MTRIIQLTHCKFSTEMYLLLCGMFFFAVTYGESMLGKGRWNVQNVEKYDGEGVEDFYLIYDVTKRRLSRQEEGYNITLDLRKDFDDSHAMQVDICKKVDGGCKPYQVLADNSIVKFIEKYTKENLQNLLTAAGVDPPEFPIAAGVYKVENYKLDYCDLPPDGPYGEYQALACTLKDSKRVGCVVADVEFVKDDDDICENNDK